jgi:hypothetical protein
MYLLHAVLWLLMVVFVGMSYLVPAYTTKPPFGITTTDQCTLFNDFASHFNFVKSTLSQGANTQRHESVYSLDNHLKINSEWAGKKISCALPFGYSPTMMWVLAPLVPFTYSTAYCIFSLFGLISVWWQTHPIRSRFGIGMLAFFNPVTYVCLALGQTAILTGAGLLYLYENTLDSSKELRWNSLILPSTILWALTAKPPLAVTAACVLIGLRKLRPVVLAAALTVVTTVIISPLLGEGWWRDYLAMLTHYDKVQAFPEYAWSLHPELMTNLRGVLSVEFGIADNVASNISSGMWIVTLVIIATCAPLLKLTAGGLWAFGVLSYLTLCPHVSDTEDLQILLLIPFCVPPHNKNLRWQDLLMLVVVSLACFTSSTRSIIFNSNHMLLFSIKTALTLFVVISYQVRQADTSRVS